MKRLKGFIDLPFEKRKVLLAPIIDNIGSIIKTIIDNYDVLVNDLGISRQAISQIVNKKANISYTHFSGLFIDLYIRSLDDEAKMLFMDCIIYYLTSWQEDSKNFSPSANSELYFKNANKETCNKIASFLLSLIDDTNNKAVINNVIHMLGSHHIIFSLSNYKKDDFVYDFAKAAVSYISKL